jgi:hypothetical protein
VGTEAGNVFAGSIGGLHDCLSRLSLDRLSIQYESYLVAQGAFSFYVK